MMMIFVPKKRAAAPPAYTPAVQTFGTGVKVTAFNDGAGLTTGDEVLIAGCVTIPPSAQGDVGILVQGATDFALYLQDTGAAYALVFKAEDTAGRGSSATKSGLAYGATVPFVCKSQMIDGATDNTALIVANGTPITSPNAGLSDPAVRNYKMPTAIHSMDGGTTVDAADLVLTGGIVMFTGPVPAEGETGLYDGIAWGDLFQLIGGVWVPKWQSGAAVNGFTPRMEQHTAAGFNAGTNNGSDGGFTTTGTVV